MVPGPQEPADFLTSVSISLSCLTLYSVGLHLLSLQQAFPCGSAGKESACNVRPQDATLKTISKGMCDTASGLNSLEKQHDA